MTPRRQIAIVLSAIYVFLSIVGGAYHPCPEGQQIIQTGVSDEGREEIVTIHNHFRSMIAQGLVAGQPRGQNLYRLSYDAVLSRAAREVSKQCKMEELEVYDARFPVGQNLFLEKSPYLDPSFKQDWETVIEMWFREHTKYTYGDPYSLATAHYTQIVWAETYAVGCDFIMYKDYSDPYPYHKLYTCNYGTKGNWAGELPYKTDDDEDECEVLDGLCLHE